MSTYVYRSSAGQELEVELPIGTAPKAIKRGGVNFQRYYGPETIPVFRTLSPLDRGEKPSVSHSLPTFYGYGQRETCWKERMQKLDLEDTPHRRMQVYKAGLGPKPKEIVRRSREAAARAGALDKFTKRGKPIARTKREVGYHLDTAKKVGDDLAFD
jgi:hypothetical protein